MNDLYSPDTQEHIASNTPAEWMGRAGVAAPTYNPQTAGCFWRGTAWEVVPVYATPTAQELLSEIEKAITKHMDSVAQAKRYEDRNSCRLYAGFPNFYQAEAVAYGQWVAACWVASNAAQAEILAGTRTIPTPEAAVLELPVMVWPV